MVFRIILNDQFYDTLLHQEINDLNWNVGQIEDHIDSTKLVLIHSKNKFH